MAGAATWRVTPAGTDRHAPPGQLTAPADAPPADAPLDAAGGAATPVGGAGAAAEVPAAQAGAIASTMAAIAARTSDDGVAMRGIVITSRPGACSANRTAVQGSCRSRGEPVKNPAGTA
jgi:hypothetical protein